MEIFWIPFVKILEPLSKGEDQRYNTKASSFIVIIALLTAGELNGEVIAVECKHPHHQFFLTPLNTNFP